MVTLLSIFRFFAKDFFDIEPLNDYPIRYPILQHPPPPPHKKKAHEYITKTCTCYNKFL